MTEKEHTAEALRWKQEKVARYYFVFVTGNEVHHWLRENTSTAWPA